MKWSNNFYRVGNHSAGFDAMPSDPKELDAQIAGQRKKIEPWLSAVFQAEHLNLLVGSGFTSAAGYLAGAKSTGMGTVKFGSIYDDLIDKHATESAKKMQRGWANIEDQFRSALAVLQGLEVTDLVAAKRLKELMNVQMKDFLNSLLLTEQGILSGNNEAKELVQSFLLSFASRSASRERLHLFTTNYDRLIEYASDLAGLRIIDRFVGTLNPIFRASRVEVDIHYNPPGIRGEPRFMEGVLRSTKLHGSLDWSYDKRLRRLSRKGIPFGAPLDHSDVAKEPVDTVMIYPNPAKDVETTEYPYAELFRDFAAAICRPNAVVFVYGYGFGDEHINRVLLDMLTIPSTHLVVVCRDPDVRLEAFCAQTREAQVSLLLGKHFGDLKSLVENYLPKPALDFISGRMNELLKSRSIPIDPTPSSSPAAI